MVSGAGRTFTILFTDVAGSTGLRRERGDAAADEMLGAHERIVRAQLAQHGGDEIQFLGDGFLAAFASVPGAVRCAVGIQRALDERNRANPSARYVCGSGCTTAR